MGGEEADRDGDAGANRREREGRQHRRDRRREGLDVERAEGEIGELAEGNAEAEEDEEGAGGGGDPCPPAAEDITRGWHAVVAVRTVDAVPPRRLLGEDQEPDDEDDGHRELGGGGEIGALDPGRVDHRGQAVDAKILDGAEVVDDLHHRQRGADDDGRPGERQRDAEEGARGARPHRPRREIGGVRAHQEEGAAGGVDVGVEDEAQHDRRAAVGLDVGEPVVVEGGRAVEGAETLLDGAGEAEELDVAVGREIGRDRERQDQRPLEDAAAGELEMGHEPCGHEAEDARRAAHRDHEQPGVAERGRQHRRGEAIAAGEDRGDRRSGEPEDGKAHHENEQDGGDGRAPSPAGPGGVRCGERGHWGPGSMSSILPVRL